MTCEGNSDACTVVATTTRDTTDGYLVPAHFCEACAAAWDEFIDNYDGPPEDGEAFRGGEAAAFQRDQMIDAQRFK